MFRSLDALARWFQETRPAFLVSPSPETFAEPEEGFNKSPVVQQQGLRINNMTSTIIVVHTPQTALPARALEQVLPQLDCQKELIDLTLAVNSGRRKAREVSDALAEGSRKLLVLFDPSYPNSLRFMSWLEYFPELKDNTVFCIELQDILAAEARKAWLFLPKELHPPDIIDYMYHAAVRQLHHDQKSNPSRR